MPAPSNAAMQEAASLYADRFRVRFNFDGAVSTNQNGPGESRRAVGFGGDKSNFSWKRFIDLQDEYNPYGTASGYPAGTLNPWSLKKWYLWGCRKFYLHNPFGKVAQGKRQQLVYEIDQYLTARDGLTLSLPNFPSEVQNTPCPWLTNDFVAVFKALCSGKRGTLDEATWNSWTTGPNAWFNPAEPIDLIVYIGGMADPGVDGPMGTSYTDYGAYIRRWEQYFQTDPVAAAKRLRDSVAPLLAVGCGIGFDALVVSPGPVAGDWIPTQKISAELQKGWWTFWRWLQTRIPKNRLYMESHPFRSNGKSNPYLGINVIADDEWSYATCCQSGTPNGPHHTSELGSVEFFRTVWQVGEDSTLFIGKNLEGSDRVYERYYWLLGLDDNIRPSGEVRMRPPQCCSPGHNYYWYHLYDKIIAFHWLEQQHTRGEVAPWKNSTKSVFLVPNSILQVLPPSYGGDPNYYRQFGSRYPTKDDYIVYVAQLIDQKKTNGEPVTYNSI